MGRDPQSVGSRLSGRVCRPWQPPSQVRSRAQDPAVSLGPGLGAHGGGSHTPEVEGRWVSTRGWTGTRSLEQRGQVGSRREQEAVGRAGLRAPCPGLAASLLDRPRGGHLSDERAEAGVCEREPSPGLCLLTLLAQELGLPALRRRPGNLSRGDQMETHREGGLEGPRGTVPVFRWSEQASQGQRPEGLEGRGDS